MGLFSFRKRQSIAATRAIEIAQIQGSMFSILAVIGYDHAGLGEYPLEVSIKSEGSKSLKDVKLSAVASDGLSLTNPGELFGKGWRQVKIPKLIGKQAMKFKLGLRANPAFQEGSITFKMQAGSPDDAVENHTVELSLPVRVLRNN